MADIHVTTISELKTALQTSGANVFLDNDLDFNSVTFGTSTWCSVQASDFDGQGHTLYNIQSGSSGTIFALAAGVSCVFHNVNFYNVLLLGSGYLLNGYNAYNKSLYVSECKFQGKIKIIFGPHIEHVITKCNFKLNGDCDISYPSYSLCYFVFETASSNFPLSTYIKMSDCYISGHLKLSSGTLTSTSFVRNVWNAYNDNATTPTMQGAPNLYNSDRATFSGGTGLTDSQLKDRDYIANNTSFPIL